MTRFILQFDTDNAAFEDDGMAGQAEVARILRHMAALVETGRDSAVIRDVNGNRVGQFEWGHE